MTVTDTLPGEFWQGIEEFNQRDYYACHDTLEALWMEAINPEKTFYQGILQIAVGLYHLSNHNWQGAVTLLGEGLNRLRRYPSEFYGVDVDLLMLEAAEVLTVLQHTEPSQVAEVAERLFNASATSENLSDVIALPKIQRVL